jgi:hypothetical protein
MPSQIQKKAASVKGITKFAERKRVLKKGSDTDLVRAFSKKGTK